MRWAYMECTGCPDPDDALDHTYWAAHQRYPAWYLGKAIEHNNIDGFTLRYNYHRILTGPLLLPGFPFPL
jgi:hypothetical protein